MFPPNYFPGTAIEVDTGSGSGTGGGEVTGFTNAALLELREALAGVVTIRRGPVFGEGGELTMEITVGDDYSFADSRAIEIDLDGTALPDLTGATVSLRLSSGVRLLIPGSVVVATGSTRTVRFEPSSSDTGVLVPGVNGVFAVKIVTAAGHTITPDEGRGRLVVLAKVA